MYSFEARHLSRVFLNASQCGKLDEQGRVDDWAAYGLRFSRRVALSAGESQEDVDEVTVLGLEDGRRRHAEDSPCPPSVNCKACKKDKV